ncbi:helix-turn-helix domain-containing protein, partial [Haemophilus influenzae]
MATRRQIYAVYRGEENLGDGTAEELAKKLNVSEKTIYSS